MRFHDLFVLSLSAMWQQRLRVILTTLGVLFAAFVLTVCISIGQGVQKAIMQEYKRIDELRLIDVFPRRLAKGALPPASKLEIKGNMSPEKRERLKKEIILRWQREAYSGDVEAGLTEELVAKIASLEHVMAAKPLVFRMGRLYKDKLTEVVTTLGVTPDDKVMAERIVAGEMLPADGMDALVSEYTLYRLGITDDSQVNQLLGKKLQFDFGTGSNQPSFNIMTLLHAGAPGLSPDEYLLLGKIANRLPKELAKLDLPDNEKKLLAKILAKPAVDKKSKPGFEFILRGILAAGEKLPRNSIWSWAYDRIDMAMPQQTAERLYMDSPAIKKGGFERLLVEVDDTAHVKAVDDQIKAMGLETQSLAFYLGQDQFISLLIFAGMTLVAVTAMLVAALGIINTMLMSVLERVREIGIMKAVGARELHLRLMFLFEGGLLGLIGGVLGLGIGWLFSILADAWVSSLVQSHLHFQLEHSLFAFPWWLVVGVPLFAWIVTTLAAYYPARQAARIDPIYALRHE